MTTFKFDITYFMPDFFLFSDYVQDIGRCIAFRTPYPTKYISVGGGGRGGVGWVCLLETKYC
jgi:hypothetical protein